MWCDHCTSPLYADIKIWKTLIFFLFMGFSGDEHWTASARRCTCFDQTFNAILIPPDVIIHFRLLFFLLPWPDLSTFPIFVVYGLSIMCSMDTYLLFFPKPVSLLPFIYLLYSFPAFPNFSSPVCFSPLFIFLHKLSSFTFKCIPIQYIYIYICFLFSTFLLRLPILDFISFLFICIPKIL